MFRDRRQDRREERRGGTGATHYRMRQKLVSIGDDYWIENDQGERVFKVDGKALRARKTLIFEDSHGTELLKIQERLARVRDTMQIEDPGGHTVATVKKALITPLRDRWAVTVADGPDLDVKGNIVDHEYTVEDGRSAVAEVSKKWFRIADTYGVEVAPRAGPRADARRHGRPGPDGARGALTLAPHRPQRPRAGPARALSRPAGKVGQGSRHDLMGPHVTDHEAVNGDGMHIDPPDVVLARTSV
jgi:uncharacterized protein YxjI